MNDNKNKMMTIIYNKHNYDIKAIGSGILNVDSVGLTKEEAEILYDKIVMPCNKYILYHRTEFKLVKNENRNLELKMKDEYKELAKQFL